MRKLLLCVMLLGSASVYSQSRWRIAAFYSADRQILPDNILSSSGYGYNYLEASKPNYTTGITTQLKVATRWSVGTGIGYSRKDYSSKYYCPTCMLLLIGPLTTPERITIVQQFIEVPALMRYYIVEKKFTLYSEAGFTANFLMQNSPAGVYDYNAGLDVNSFILGGQVGIGAGYTIGKVFEINLGAVYRNSISEYVDSNDASLRSFGMMTSAAFKF